MNRIEAIPSSNGTHKTTSRKTAAPKPKKSRKTAAKSSDRAEFVATAQTTVWICAALSGTLNAYALFTHSPTPLLGVVLGLAIPLIVLRLGAVTGKLWKRGNRPLAYFTGGSGLGLLLLSVWHCADAISLLTGGTMFAAIPLAVAIDCGLVSCELAVIAER